MTLRRFTRGSCLILIGFLYVFSVPWYRATDDPLHIWLGLPDWVAVALCCYVGVAILNAIAWSLVEISDHAGEPTLNESTRTEPVPNEAVRSSQDATRDDLGSTP